MDNFSGLSIADLPSPLAEAIATVPPGLGKRQRTRRQLLLAAVRVFAVRGIANTTIQEIAQQAEMTTGTVYNHFESREAIVAAVAAWFTGTMCESIQQSQRNVARGAQRMAIGQRRYAWLARASPRWTTALLDVSRNASMLTAQIADYALADLRLGVAQKDFRVPDERAAMALVMGVGLKTMVDIVSGGMPDDYDVATTTIVLRGLGMPFERAAEFAARPLPPLEVAFAPALFDAPPASRKGSNSRV